MTVDRDAITAARWTAIIAAGLMVFIIAYMLLTLRQDRERSPITSTALTKLTNELADRPNDEALKTLIRNKDTELRQGYFLRQQTIHQGGWLLVASGAALVLSLKSLSTLTQTPAMPTMTRTDTYQQNRMARLGVAVSGAILLGACGTIIVLARPTIPEPKTDQATEMPLPPASELAKNWGSFRGPSGNGIVTGTIPPTWDAASKTNILWKSPVPLPGHSSPIVFDGKVFLTGSDGSLQEIMGFDAKTGAQLFRTSVPRGTLQPPNVFEDTGYAAPTPVTDGVRVYGIFASGDIGAVSFSGKRLWARNLGAIESRYGYAASLAIHAGTVIVQWDNGDPEQNLSFLIGLDGATGRQLWKTPRPVGNSWASPVVVNDVVYTAGLPYVMAHSAVDGKELWRAKLMDGDIACSPAVHSGVAYVANDRAVAAAIRADGKGDVTDTHVSWKVSDIQLPDMVSPLTDGKHLLLTTGGGDLFCLDAATGKTIWTHSLGTMVHASPLLVGESVCLSDIDGVTHMFDLSADPYKELNANKLGEAITASPAVVGGKVFIRTKDSLFCIGAPNP